MSLEELSTLYYQLLRQQRESRRTANQETHPDLTDENTSSTDNEGWHDKTYITETDYGKSTMSESASSSEPGAQEYNSIESSTSTTSILDYDSNASSSNDRENSEMMGDSNASSSSMDE